MPALYRGALSVLYTPKVCVFAREQACGLRERERERQREREREREEREREREREERERDRVG